MTRLFDIGRNCWRCEWADKAALIVDAADYFRFARRAMLAAHHQILMIGWDFDTRIELDRDADDDLPRHLGPFLSHLAKDRPDLHIHMLKWDMGALKLLGRGSTLFRVARWIMQDRIAFRLDSVHPTGGAHHHKVVVIDDAIAFCGGIDMTGSRWDTRAHLPDDDRRMRPTTHRRYGPWHDASMAVTGPAARALGDYGRARWEMACNEAIAPPPEVAPIWPDGLEAMARDQPVAISRTRGGTPDQSSVREIEQLCVDLIKSAEHHIYIESQYFASRVIAQAIIERLRNPDPPEIVVINPRSADGWLEEKAMGPARAILLDHIHRYDGKNRFRLYSPVNARGEDIYVHAKIMIVDDRVLRVGSANCNNRSMGLDSECDVTLCADEDDKTARTAIAARRADLLAEHLGVTVAQIETCLEKTGSLIDTIETLRGEGRSLLPFTPPEFSETELDLARTEMLDPESGQEQFEPAARPGLLSRLHIHGRGHGRGHGQGHGGKRSS